MNKNKWFLNGGRGSGKTFRLLWETYENKIADLEKENAELKEELKQWKDGIALKDEEIGCIETDFNTFKSKAKVFIRSLKSLIEDVCDINYLSKDNTRLLVEAEQFLSEVENV